MLLLLLFNRASVDHCRRPLVCRVGQKQNALEEKRPFLWQAQSRSFSSVE